MAITRRQFIKRSGLVAAGGMFGPTILGHPWVRRALAETIGDRYFVVIYLDGGNDGLNTIVPVNNGGGTLRADYEFARSSNIAGGGIQLTPGDLAASHVDTDPHTGAQLALHPGFATGLKPLYDLGKVAIFQGCGYPEYSLSHDTARTIWKTADPLAAVLDGSGWVGRHLAAEYNSNEIPAISIADSVPREFQQTGTSVLAIQNLQQFSFPYDTYSGPDIALKRDAYLALHSDASATGQPILAYVGDTGKAGLLTSEQYPALDGYYQAGRPAGIKQAYDNVGGSFAFDLREVAKVIFGVNNNQLPLASQARFFQVANSGYDTHSNQGGADPGGQHFSLHREVGNSLLAFYNDIADMGVADKVCILIYSEFSRRILQNESGTDHGSQGPVFVIGGKVNGGVYGNHPDINQSSWDSEGNTVYSQDNTNPFRSTDFRDVYGTVLKHWFNGTPDSVIAPGILPIDAGDPTLYWTAPNLDITRPSDSVPLFAP